MDIRKMMETPQFEGVAEEELVDIMYANLQNIKHYKRGEIIAKQGDEIRSLLILTEGSVNNLMGDKKKFIVKTLHAPNYLQPACVFATNSYCPTTIKAATDCELVIVNRENLIKYSRRNNQIMLNILSEISDRFDFLAKRLNEFSTMTLKERLLKYIDENGPITNQTALAQHMGVARPSLSRALSELQEEGKI